MKDKSLLIPKYRFKNVTDIKTDDLIKMGAKGVGLDIDNVIAPDGTFNYLEGIKDWVKYITDSGIPITIISNGTIFRVKAVSKYLGNIPFLHLSKKPSPRNLIRAADKMGRQQVRSYSRKDRPHTRKEQVPKLL